MADDMVGRRLFIGKTKNEILTSLGKPNWNDGGTFQYKIAHIPRCSWIWDCALEIHFDQAGKVVGTDITD